MPSESLRSVDQAMPAYYGFDPFHHRELPELRCDVWCRETIVTYETVLRRTKAMYEVLLQLLFGHHKIKLPARERGLTAARCIGNVFALAKYYCIEPSTIVVGLENALLDLPKGIPWEAIT